MQLFKVVKLKKKLDAITMRVLYYFFPTVQLLKFTKGKF